MTNIWFYLYKLKMRRCCALDLNPGPQGGWRWQFHCAIAAARWKFALCGNAFVRKVSLCSWPPVWLTKATSLQNHWLPLNSQDMEHLDIWHQIPKELFWCGFTIFDEYTGNNSMNTLSTVRLTTVNNSINSLLTIRWMYSRRLQAIPFHTVAVRKPARGIL